MPADSIQPLLDRIPQGNPEARQNTIPSLLGGLRTFARCSATAVLLVAAATLIAWLLPMSPLAPLTRGRAAMDPLAALAFTLSSVSLLLLLRLRYKLERHLSAGLSCCVLLLGLLFLARAVFGHGLGLEAILSRGALQAPTLEPAAATLFMAVGAALLVLDSEGTGGRRPAQVLCLVVALFGIAAFGADLVGYASPGNATSTPAFGALNALCFALLSLAALCARPDTGLMRVITVDAPGGEVARRLLPAAMFAPLALCVLCYLGYRANWYGSGFGLILLTTLNSAVFAMLVWRAAGALNHTDARRREIEAERNELNVRLQRAMAETHHRVRNNLQIISALADMQVMNGSQSVPVSEVQRIGSQVQALAAVHDILTRESKTDVMADSLSAAEVLDKLAALLQQTVHGRSIRVAAEAARITGRQASAIVVVANELILNALKNSDGDVEVEFTTADGRARLVVEDRGLGFPAGFDPSRDANTGLELVQQISEWDLQGTIRFANRGSGGGCVTIDMPLAIAAGNPVPA